MTRVIATAVSIGVCLLLLQAFAQQEEGEVITGEEAEHLIEVFAHHKDELLKLPDVFGVFPSTSTKEILVETDYPEGLPQEIEGVKIKAIPPPQVLPPPPGVIVLRPGGVVERREDIEVCPEGFKEERQYRWRFCQPTHGNPEPFPSYLMNPPIAGIPFEKALEIYERRKDELFNLPGVGSVGLGADGIEVATDQPGLVPGDVEGLPVRTGPRETAEFLSHTASSPERPLHGAVAIDDPAAPPGVDVTLTGIVLSGGKPWLVSVAHFINGCNNEAPCRPCDPPAYCEPGYQPILNLCTHYTSHIVRQPIATNPETVGRASRWTRLVGGQISSDVSATFVDSDTEEGNGSLSVDRVLENYGSFKGTEDTPVQDAPILIVSSVGNVLHTVQGHVSNPSKQTQVQFPICAGSSGGSPITLQDQIQYDTNTDILPGMSGSIVLDGNGDVLGMMNWRFDSRRGGGTRASKIKSRLGFDAWYGTESANDNTFGFYRSSTREWYLDGGDGRWGTAGDIYSTSFGAVGDKPVTGNWYNSTSLTGAFLKIGTFRPSTGYWYLDKNGNNTWDGTSDIMDGPFGASTDLPVAGDWNGDGTTDIGTFRPSTGLWYLDIGNGVWNGCGSFPAKDRCLGPFGGATDLPLGGNWTGFQPAGGLKDKIGVFEPQGNSADPRPVWVLDSGNGQFVSVEEEQSLGTFGQNGDLPVVWNKSVVKGS